MRKLEFPIEANEQGSNHNRAWSKISKISEISSLSQAKLKALSAEEWNAKIEENRKFLETEWKVLS